MGPSGSKPGFSEAAVGLIPDFGFREAIVRQRNGSPGWVRRSGSIVVWLLAVSMMAHTQEQSPSGPQAEATTAAIQQLQDQVRELRSVVQEMRTEAADSRAESADLRRELQALRSQLSASRTTMPPETSAATVPPSTQTPPGANEAQEPSLELRVSKLEDSSQLVTAKVDQQYQTKVESASKYRARLSGVVLLNLFSNRGSSDNQDFPSYAMAPLAYSSNANIGASLRQSEIGLEVFGPRLAGAKTSGNLQADFAGGFPNAPNGVNSGIFRMRIASMRMDWQHTSIVVGQDNLFLSPSSPTSFASLAIPAFSYAGNLWGWIPQVRVEHRFAISEGNDVSIQAGLLDNVTGEPPYTNNGRTPEGGEQSGQPSYAARASWNGRIFGQPLTLGTAGYYSPQKWGFDRRVTGWAGTLDWEIPLTPWVAFSGEFYRGRALGGLGGGIGRSVLFSGNPLDPTTLVRGLNAIGGWSQLKVKASAKLEINGAFGLDNAYAEDLGAFSAVQSYLDPSLARNFGSLINFIYRPKSNLLFSTEYRRLLTSRVYNESYPAGQVNLMMGVLF
jgi:hypothetical protein